MIRRVRNLSKRGKNNALCSFSVFAAIGLLAPADGGRVTGTELTERLNRRWVGVAADQVTEHFGHPSKDKRGDRGRRKLVYRIQEPMLCVNTIVETSLAAEPGSAVHGVRTVKMRDAARIIFDISVGGIVDSVEVRLRKPRKASSSSLEEIMSCLTDGGTEEREPEAHDSEEND